MGQAVLESVAEGWAPAIVEGILAEIVVVQSMSEAVIYPAEAAEVQAPLAVDAEGSTEQVHDR